MSETIRSRDEIPAKYKWNAASVYPTPEAWANAADNLLVKLAELGKLTGHIAESAKHVADALDLSNALFEEAGKVITYAYNAQAVDNSDADATRMLGKTQSIFGQVFGGVGFIQPEILAIDAQVLAQWRKDEPRLKIYDQFLDDLIRQQAHVRSAEVEEIFGLAQDPFGGLANTVNVLTNSEMKYPNARTSSGDELPVTQGTIEELLASTDRETRRTAWEGFRDSHLEFKN